MDLAEEAYRLARRFPDVERYALANQVMRCGSSIPANIAEGHGRMGPREFANFLSIARGSLAELDTHLLLAVRLAYVSESDLAHANSLGDEVGRMLSTLIGRLRR